MTEEELHKSIGAKNWKNLDSKRKEVRIERKKYAKL